MNANKIAGIFCLVVAAMAAAMNFYFEISTLDMPLSAHTLQRIAQLSQILFAGSIALAVLGSWLVQSRPLALFRFIGYTLFLVICGQAYGIVLGILLEPVWQRALQRLMEA